MSKIELIEMMEENIFLQLTEKSDEFLSVTRLFNDYSSKSSDTSSSLKDIHEDNLNKKLFVTACELLNTKYNNVHKIYKNNICHLCFLTDKTMLSNALYKINLDHDAYAHQNEKYNSSIDHEFQKMNNCDIVEYIINNNDVSSRLSLTEYFNEIDTVMHILSRNGKFESIEKLSKHYNVNFNQLNAHGESIMDVAKDDIYFVKKLLKLICDYKQTESHNENTIMRVEMKNLNTNLLETNEKLVKEINSLNDELTYQADMSYRKNIIVGLLSSYFLYVVLNIKYW